MLFDCVKRSLLIVLAWNLFFGSGMAVAARVADVSASKHNLSANSSNTVRADEVGNGGTDEICVFCHTPHGANIAVAAPLWNRSQSAASYVAYSSSSLDAGVLDAPGGSTKLCLSCHDGTVAVGSVNNKPGSGGYDSAYDRPDPIAMLGTEANMIPSGVDGFTRRLGVDLSNDHPVSLTYDDTLAGLDGELFTPTAAPQQEITTDGGSTTLVGNRIASGLQTKPILPLEPKTTENVGQIQCSTCHDPHLIEDDMTATGPALGASIKFLRLNRFQLNNPGDVFDKDNDIMCLACHNKAGWENSVHAVGATDGEPADDKYKNNAMTTSRDFPAELRVYQAACLNCHDTHTESGAKRLLRQGTDSDSKSSIEETCYQCHATGADSIVEENVGVSDTDAPDIETEFNYNSITMPITTQDQRASSEPAHDIIDGDFLETPTKLGKGVLANRHVECSDCHNPHRVIRNSRFNADGIQDTSTPANELRTHEAGLNSTSDGSNDGSEGNVASGALRGAWGVEPVVGTLSVTWPEPDSNISYDVKKGDPDQSILTSEASSYLTREYQLCFKCHSDYSLDETDMPLLGAHSGGTSYNTNQMQRYTNVAAEFASVSASNPPTTGGDQGEEVNLSLACNGLDCNPSPSGPTDDNNHRSWHPVMYPTGRDGAERGDTGFDNIRAPFADNVGTQTMHCSDCHGASGSWTQGVGPNSNVQGPHGSNNNFLLRGSWNPASNTPNNPGFCGNCHNPTGNNVISGFGQGVEASHSFDQKDDAPCGICHIAVPHGWKNKAFLVNINCIGPESGEVGGYDEFGCKSVGAGYDAGPYYVNARLKINSWAESRSWAQGNCSGLTWMENSCGTY